MLGLQDGNTWLLSPPDQSLALLLADNGYDVWLTSTRGTKYSRGHTSLSPKDAVNILSANYAIFSINFLFSLIALNDLIVGFLELVMG